MWHPSVSRGLGSTPNELGLSFFSSAVNFKFPSPRCSPRYKAGRQRPRAYWCPCSSRLCPFGRRPCSEDSYRINCILVFEVRFLFFKNLEVLPGKFNSSSSYSFVAAEGECVRNGRTEVCEQYPVRSFWFWCRETVQSFGLSPFFSQTDGVSFLS